MPNPISVISASDVNWVNPNTGLSDADTQAIQADLYKLSGSAAMDSPAAIQSLQDSLFTQSAKAAASGSLGPLPFTVSPWWLVAGAIGIFLIARGGR